MLTSCTQLRNAGGSALLQLCSFSRACDSGDPNAAVRRGSSAGRLEQPGCDPNDLLRRALLWP